MAGGILDPATHEAFIRDYARQKGLNPDWLVALAAAEGLRAWSASNPNAGSSIDVASGQPFSFGDFQLNIRNGLGGLALRQGIDPRDPNQWQAADKFAIDYIAATRDLSPWKGDPVAREYIRRYGTGTPSAFTGGSAGGGAATSPPPPDPGQVEAARGYLASLSAHPNRAGDTSNINPVFAVRLAAAMQDARAQGLPVTLASGYRDKDEIWNQENAAGQPHSRSSTYDHEGNSSHSYGIAVDVGGIGAPGSDTAKKWFDIAAKHGIYNPYGWEHPKEWNHFQFLAQPLEANPQLLASLKATGGDMGKAWALASAAGGGGMTGMVASQGGAGGAASSSPAPSVPAPSPGEMTLASMGDALAQMGSGGASSGASSFEDPPDGPAIRTIALQGFQAPPQEDYLSEARNSTIGALQGATGVNYGAPSMTSFAAADTQAGTGTPATGLEGVSPLTYATSLARYSRIS